MSRELTFSGLSLIFEAFSTNQQNQMFYNLDITRAPNFFSRLAVLFLGVCIALLASAVAHGQIEGFTQPFRTIELSSDESGAIAELNIEEGDSIRENDIVAKLDCRVQELQLEIAKHMASTKSELVAAKETLQKRQAIVARLRQLKKSGHATESEIIRSEMELSIANAKYLAAQEEQVVHDIEKRRAEVQLERRTIRAPFNGVVSKLHRREGEYLSPLHPEVATIIQIDRLYASFNVPSSQISAFEVGKEFIIEMDNGKSVPAKVHRISVQTDAQSGTIEVKLVIDNSAMEIRSGEICTLNI